MPQVGKSTKKQRREAKAKLWKEIPVELHERISDVEVFPRSGEFGVYLGPGWRLARTDAQHKRERTLAVHSAEEVSIPMLVEAIESAQRCYCPGCDVETTDDWTAPIAKHVDMEARIEALKLRRLIAKANKIPLDGAPDHEAKIDAILEEK